LKGHIQYKLIIVTESSMIKISHPKIIGFDQRTTKKMVISKGYALKCIKQKDFVSNKEIVQLAVESTITLIINQQYQIDIICTYGQLEALCVGYLFSEGFISSMDDIRKMEYTNDHTVEIFLPHLDDKDYSQGIELRSSGCRCFKNQHRESTPLPVSNVTITPDIIFTALSKMNELGRIWRSSGGTHMSGLFRSDGILISFAEDIGRHNTLDKIIGEAIIGSMDLSTFFVTTSGRLSAAMISKLARARIPVAISISAPTAQGLKIATLAKMTIVGFSREPFFNIYTVPERIRLSP